MTESVFDKDNSARSLSALAKDLGLPYLSQIPTLDEAQVFTLLPAEVASQLQVVPLGVEGRTLLVAVADPLNLDLENRLAALTGHRIGLHVAEPEAIANALRRAEASRRMLENVSSEFRPQIVTENSTGGETIVDLETLQGQEGIVRLTNTILMSALERGASDVHIEAVPDRVEVKYRIDGVLCPAASPIGAAHHAELVSRIKVMADLDISERRIPQDGRFRLRVNSRDIDFRVSILPTQFGEDVVVRILDKSNLIQLGHDLTLESLGLAERDVAALRSTVRIPNGLVLVTGPTGSGKTTTLYGTISELASGQEKIITIEDPIEYQIEGIVQVAVNEKLGMTFSKGLRSILRHDPDKVFVGEIRDFETASIAVQAALTGHLVLASVHANSAVDVLSRFAHWGIDLNDFVSALRGVFAQRLFRKLCDSCAEPTSAPEGNEGKWRRAHGCADCFGTGYRGRIAAIEHLHITPEIAEMMVARAPAARLDQAAKSGGMRSLRDAALELAASGQSSFEEIQRVTPEY